MPILSASGGQVMPGPKRIYTDFKQNPICCADAGGGAPTGATGDVNFMLVPSYGLWPAAGFEYTIHGTQTIVAPVLTANGLDIGMDQTAADGLELDNGITARNPVAFVVGTDGPCYVEVEVTLEDVSGFTPFIVGFRKVAARVADYNDWTDAAVIGCYAGDIKIETILNNAATSTTDTTNNWADGEKHRLRVNVDSVGKVTFLLDGAAPTTVPSAFTFDSGDTIMPVVLFLHGVDVGGKAELSVFDAGAG